MRLRKSGSSKSSSRLQATGGMLLLFCAISLGAFPSTVLRAQALIGATVEMGQNSLTLPPGGAIYIYGMGTGGANSATNFSQGPYQHVIDAGGNVVAGLAMTQSNTNSFTTNCADFTIAGVGVSEFKAVSSWYGANNQPHPTSAYVGFPVYEPSLVVLVAIAGGEDHLNLQGLPGLQIDAQKRLGQSHGIAVVIGHASLAPGRYTATEITEGDPGCLPDHEGDLIGAFVFTSGSGTPTAESPPLPAPPESPDAGGQPPPYAFNGAQAEFEARLGGMSVPVKLTVSMSSSEPNQCTVDVQYGAFLSLLSSKNRSSCRDSKHMLWAGPSDLARLADGGIPPGWGAAGARILPGVIVSVPAGKFVTDEISFGKAAIWYDDRSGLLVKAEGNLMEGAEQQIPALRGLTQASLVLRKTNIPMDEAPTSPLRYLWMVVVVALAGPATYGVVRMVRTSGLQPARAVVSAGSIRAVTTPPATDPAMERSGDQSPRGRPTASDTLDKLANLKALLDAGLITAEEFEHQKTKLLE